jgi:cytochrome c oxidase subunit 4
MKHWRKFLIALGALLGLLAATIGCAFLPIGAGHTPAALFISCAKSAVILIVFMRVGRATRLAKLAFAAGIFWFGIIAALGLSDYLTRP